MVLSEFDPKLLNFLYELTKFDNYKSSIEIAKAITLENSRKVTSKTISNWFKYLHTPYSYRGYRIEEKFSYFPAIFLNKLGLRNIIVFYENASQILEKIFPMRHYVGWLYDFYSNQEILSIEYTVPNENLSDFLAVLNKLKKKGFCSNYRFYISSPSFAMYSPFHKVIDKSGIFHWDKNDPQEIEYQIKRLNTFLRVMNENKFPHVIKNNPLIIPVVAEHMYQHRSAIQIWKAIKSKLGSNVSDYIRHKRKEKLSDWSYIKRIQEIIKNLRNYGLLNQMRLVYFPFEVCNNFWVWIIFKLKHKYDLLEIAKSALTNSISTKVFLMDNGRTLFTMLVNGNSMQNLFETLTSFRVERMFLFDYPKSINLVTTTRYTLLDYAEIFNPKDCSWRFNKDSLISYIENLH